MALTRKNAVCLCGSEDFATVFTYNAPPKEEVRFGFSREEGYFREIVRCRGCGHFLSLHEMDMSSLYSEEYVDATYQGNLARTFEKIINLPEGKSDNKARVKRVECFARGYFGESYRERRRLLDVGSGLCVFPYEMKRAGWQCMAMDTDIRQAAHAKECAGVDSVCAEFGSECGLDCFDLISFNKVLEHVEDPISMLSAAKDQLAPGGLIYVELPDGEGASRDPDGPEREEFFIEHHHVFSAASCAILVERAGLNLLELQRMREASGKYSLAGFVTNA